jgi:hypothetical protein
MLRQCTQCQRPYTSHDLAKEESKGMEAERKAQGLEGMLFRYYTCPACNRADIFVDLSPVQGETAEDFQRRRAALEETVAKLRADAVAVVLKERPSAPGDTAS